MESYLSEDVRKMYTIIPEISKQIKSNKTNYITSNCTFDWELIKKEFHDILNDIDDDKSHSWFRNTVSKLAMVIIQTEIVVKNIDKEVILKNCSWTNRLQDIEKCLNKYLQIQETCVENVEIILMLTSIIERSLGDVLLLKCKNVPFLLRDLLTTEELKDIFGQTTISFSRLVLGTPEGLNLRNIVWHSFPTTKEMHLSYSSLLFVMITSFGDILNNQNLTNMIIYRPLLYQSIQTQFEIIYTQIQNITNRLDTDDLLRLIKSTKCIPKNFICYWDYIVRYYRSKKWQDCLLLIIFQFESIFRYIYCRINDQIDRLLTAEIKVLYTTLDVIFDDDVIDNKIFDIYNHNYLALLHDVFAYISGPRLRDKLSHGEVDSRALDRNSTEVLLVIIYYGIIIFEQHDCPNWLTPVENYKCLFHRNSMFSYNLNDLLIETKGLDKVSIPDEFDINLIVDSESIDNLIVYNKSVDVLIFARPKGEKEIVTLLIQIVDNLHKTVNNFKESLRLKYTGFVERKLRSKRRKTYQQLIQFLPDLYNTIRNFCTFLLKVFETVQKGRGINDSNLLKFLKSMLQCAENLTKYLHTDHNKWNESVVIIDRVYEDMKFIEND